MYTAAELEKMFEYNNVTIAYRGSERAATAAVERDALIAEVRARARGEQAAREAEFKKMTRAEKRVAIARDVISQLSTGLLKARRGVYFASDPRDHSTGYVGCEEQLSDIIATDVSLCTVCGIGSLFVSAVRIANNLTIKEAFIGDDDGLPIDSRGMVDFRLGFNQDSISGHLEQWFSLKQLRLIETAFEGNVFNQDLEQEDSCDVSTGGHSPEFRTARLWNSRDGLLWDDGKVCNHRIDSPTETMKQLMKNIIRNNGTFVPEQDIMLEFDKCEGSIG